MNRVPAIVAAVVALLLVRAEPIAAEEGAPASGELLVIGRGAAAVSFQCGEKEPAKIVAREADGVWSGEWPAPTGCEARLEMIRARRPVGIREVEILALRFSVTNRSTEPCAVPVFVRIAPAKVAAPAIHGLAFERHAFSIDGQPILASDTPSRGAILAESAFAPRPLTPENEGHVASAAGECRGEMCFDLTLAPGQTQALGFLCPSPTSGSPEVAVTLSVLRDLRIDELFPAKGQGTRP